MTNSKRRRLAKVQVGGDKGVPSQLGSRAARRHPARSADKVRSLALPNVAPELFVGDEAIRELEEGLV